MDSQIEYFRVTDLPHDLNEALADLLEEKPANPRYALASMLARPRVAPSSCLIYASPISANSLCCVLGATAMNIPFELKTLDLFKGEHKTPEYLKINFMGQIPGLHIPDLGIKIGESAAILRTLANVYPRADHWYPSDPAQRAEVDRFLDWRQTAWYPSVSAWLYFVVGFLTDGPAAVEKREKAVAMMDALLSEIVQSGFVAGPAASIADLAIVALFHYAAADVTWQMPPAWTAYWNRVRAAVGEDAYAGVFAPMDGFVAQAAERNKAKEGFMAAAQPAEQKQAQPEQAASN